MSAFGIIKNTERQQEELCSSYKPPNDLSAHLIPNGVIDLSDKKNVAIYMAGRFMNAAGAFISKDKMTMSVRDPIGFFINIQSVNTWNDAITANKTTTPKLEKPYAATVYPKLDTYLPYYSMTKLFIPEVDSMFTSIRLYFGMSELYDDSYSDTVTNNLRKVILTYDWR